MRGQLEGTLLKKAKWQYDAYALAQRTTKIALIPIATFDWLMDTGLSLN
jgi:hypothetical protein